MPIKDHKFMILPLNYLKSGWEMYYFSFQNVLMSKVFIVGGFNLFSHRRLFQLDVTWDSIEFFKY